MQYTILCGVPLLETAFVFRYSPTEERCMFIRSGIYEIQGVEEKNGEWEKTGKPRKVQDLNPSVEIVATDIFPL